MSLTRETFIEAGLDLSEEYLPKTKTRDMEIFLSALFDELIERELVDREDAELEWGGDPDTLFDDPEEL